MDKYYLSICAVVKNERPYIEEWLAFHLLQGVEHFFLYDNDSTDGTYELLQSMEKTGYITLTRDFRTPLQLRAYNDALKNYESQTEWLLFIDVDEFCFATQGLSLADSLKQPAFTHMPGVAIHWLLFGSNSHENKSEGLIIERFTKRAREVDQHVKSAVRPRLTLKVADNPHSFIFRRNLRCVDEHGEHLPVQYALKTAPSVDILRVHHYHTKSKEEAKLRWGSLPRSDSGKMRNFSEQFKPHDRNDVEDVSAAAYSYKVKQMMEVLRCQI